MYVGGCCLCLGVANGECCAVAKELDEPPGRHKSIGNYISLLFLLTGKKCPASPSTVSWAWGGVMNVGLAVVHHPFPPYSPKYTL